VARKQKDNPLKAIFDLFSLLPWWVGTAFAPISYFVLHALAAPYKITTADANQMEQWAVRSLITALANFGQYAVPLLCVAGAIASAWQGRKRRALISGIAGCDAADSLDDMSWQDFELTVSEAFRLDGFAIEERGGANADGGIDLILHKEGEKFFVQCKQWRAFKVGVNVVRELYGVMAAGGATGGFVVTSGAFTKDAAEFASGRNVILVDGRILFDMIKRVERAPTALRNPAHTNLDLPPTMQDTIKCPVCRSKMIERVAKRGANSGITFWGCSRYPDCKGTRAMS
jgi:restriction system protein